MHFLFSIIYLHKRFSFYKDFSFTTQKIFQEYAKTDFNATKFKSRLTQKTLSCERKAKKAGELSEFARNDFPAGRKKNFVKNAQRFHSVSFLNVKYNCGDIEVHSNPIGMHRKLI